MVTVFDHPLIKHKLSILRMKQTGTKQFKEIVTELSMLMGYEVTRDLQLEEMPIETPICKTTGYSLAGKKIALVPTFAAGNKLNMPSTIPRPALSIGTSAIFLPAKL